MNPLSHELGRHFHFCSYVSYSFNIYLFRQKREKTLSIRRVIAKLSKYPSSSVKRRLCHILTCYNLNILINIVFYIQWKCQCPNSFFLGPFFSASPLYTPLDELFRVEDQRC